MKQAYQKEINEIIAELETNLESGLSAEQLKKRIEKYGANELPEKKPPSWLFIFLSQFASPLIYILVLAAVLIFFVSDNYFDAFIILGILFFNAIIGTIQEGRTRKILISLKKLISQQAIVIRNSKREIISTKNIVPGDIILVQEGQRIPADGRIIDCAHLRIDESMLTGESEPIEKSSITITEDVPLPDRKNMLFSGTYVLSGWAKAIVIATGINSEIGKIQTSIEEIKTDVPLAQEMHRLSWFILVFSIGVCFFLFIIGIINGQSIKELIVMLTALFICVVPEGLPVVLTLVLVSGVYRMARRQVLVKNMQAVEGLGHTQVIIIDKTGTLTRNEMIVSQLFADNKIWAVSGKGYYPEGSIFSDGQESSLSNTSNLYEMAHAASLLSYSTVVTITNRGIFEVKGDPTEAALSVFAQKLGIDREQLKKEYKQIYEIPFESRHRYHALFYEKNNTGIAYIAGSPENMIERMAKDSDALQNALNSFLQEGLRVIAIAKKEFDLQKTNKLQENEKATYFESIILHDLQILGLCGIQDAIRPEAASTITLARKAGLHIIMATGDHQRTALAIAKKVGIYKEDDEAIDATEFATLTDEQLKELLPKVTVFSRVSAQQKLKIIQLLHEQGKSVAMTGDGINDAPSLVAADIGIGMGGVGSEIAQQASDIILLNDSIINIINAIEEGRHTIYTLRRVILYFFSTNFAEILIIAFAFILNILFPRLNLAFPLLAAQILWLNLITDGFLDSALALEKKEKKLLFNESWLKKPLRIIDKTIIQKMFYMAIPMALGSLFLFMLYDHIDLKLAHTMTLVCLATFQWFNAFNCRSETESIFKLGIFSNKWLILATCFVAFLQLLLLHIPYLQLMFRTTPLNIYQWIFILCISSSIIWIEEIRKLISRIYWHD
jgi:magnesium-transporting ATPase (P-type)